MEKSKVEGFELDLVILATNEKLVRLSKLQEIIDMIYNMNTVDVNGN